MLLERRNGRKASVDAGFEGGDFDTMAFQQAVAKSFCWKARHPFDAPFFYL
jgi:hypothetical protein